MKKYVGTIIGFVLAIGLIVAGVMLNQQRDVLNKAIRICLECVGIG